MAFRWVTLLGGMLLLLTSRAQAQRLAALPIDSVTHPRVAVVDPLDHAPALAPTPRPLPIPVRAVRALARAVAPEPSALSVVAARVQPVAITAPLPIPVLAARALAPAVAPEPSTLPVLAARVQPVAITAPLPIPVLAVRALAPAVAPEPSALPLLAARVQPVAITAPLPIPVLAVRALAPAVAPEPSALPVLAARVQPVAFRLPLPIPARAARPERVAAPARLPDFVRAQLANPRVQTARAAADAPWREAFARAGLRWPSAHVYLRAFKREHLLEVWGERQDGSYALVKTFAICSLGGSGLGPKRRQGDEQVPEGFYHVIGFNPSSEYYLSLRLDYPNAADLARAGGGRSGAAGSDIYLHGGCKSAGCLPLTNAGIEQVYWLAVQARAGGQRRIRIDIFPARLGAASWEQLKGAFADQPALLAFWAELRQGYDAFERTHRLPDVAIDASGHYHVTLTSW